MKQDFQYYRPRLSVYLLSVFTSLDPLLNKYKTTFQIAKVEPDPSSAQDIGARIVTDIETVRPRDHRHPNAFVIRFSSPPVKPRPTSNHAGLLARREMTTHGRRKDSVQLQHSYAFHMDPH